MLNDMQIRIVQDFFKNPAQTQLQLGKKHSCSVGYAARAIGQYFKLPKKQKDEILNRKLLTIKTTDI